MLWITKEKIEKIWPLVCNDNPKGPDIRKFETLGTRSFPIEQGIGEAINFHTAIGSKRKEERIRYLKNYWASRVQNIPKVRINTSLKDEYACAICGVSIDGMTPGALDSALFNEYKIHTVGIVYTQLSFKYPIENDEEIVNAFEKAITPKTKIFHITHVVNWVGQIMPVKKLCALAKKHNIETIVDGAHSFGLMDFAIPDLGCDYFGASLHKFLSAPIGSGMLWIKKEKIEKIWPLVCNDNPKGPDIRKFETLGTRSFPIEQGIGEAINFHTAIGSKRKEERIRYLKNYWATRVQNIPKVRINTSLKDEYACAICGVSIDGMTPGALDSALFNEYKIHTVGIVWENISCVRITPHVYTRLQDLDKLVYAIEKIAKKA
jgi:selenocysteine lyase/cysteine desulfurase